MKALIWGAYEVTYVSNLSSDEASDIVERNFTTQLLPSLNTTLDEIVLEEQIAYHQKQIEKIREEMQK